MEPITLGLIGLGAYLLFKPRRRPASVRSNYSFSYRKRNGSWRAYFVGTPPSMSHVLRDDNGYYVCWDRPLRTEHEARQVARRWSDNYGR